jgi:hypothetical protein
VSKFALTIVTLALTALVFAAGASASYTRYFGPAVLNAGFGAGSAYDNACERWFSNDMTRSVYSAGTVTFIDTAGRWHDTVTSWGTETHMMPDHMLYTKKTYCYDSWWSWYWANCWRASAFITGCVTA